MRTGYSLYLLELRRGAPEAGNRFMFPSQCWTHIHFLTFLNIHTWLSFLPHSLFLTYLHAWLSLLSGEDKTGHPLWHQLATGPSIIKRSCAGLWLSTTLIGLWVSFWILPILSLYFALPLLVQAKCPNQMKGYAQWFSLLSPSHSLHLHGGSPCGVLGQMCKQITGQGSP